MTSPRSSQRGSNAIAAATTHPAQSATGGRDLPAVAWGPAGAALAAVAVVLVTFSNGYGWHRDELYFRMLKPGWGYVDQPPLTPLLVRWFSEHVADQPWAIRIPSTVSTVLAVLIVTLITRELGGRRGAQALCAWAYGFAATPLVFGHVMLTSSIDLFVWPLVTLMVIRAVLRADPRWWLAAGVVVGLSMYNKLLVAMLLVALAAAVAIVGPRRILLSPWVLGSAVLALVIGAPNIVYQATHHWPELTMGQALADDNSGSVRTLELPFLLILLGPPITAIWIAGLVALWRRTDWRPIRFVAVGFPILLVLVFLAGTQFYYPCSYLAVLFAAGCVPTVDLMARSALWRGLVVAAVVVNSVVSMLLALPVIPVGDLHGTPIGAINQTVGDSVGWPVYVGQIAKVYDALPLDQRANAVVVASNYGEAGAVARFGPALGVPGVYGTQNQLWFQARPPAATRTVVFVGGEEPYARRWFAVCRVAARLHNGVDVDNEEQGEPVAVCRGAKAPWPVLWKALQHYD